MVFCPFEAMPDRTVIMADPFPAKYFASGERAIRQLKLEYLGEVAHEGKTCHQVRCWAGYVEMNNVYGIRDWLIDAQSLLPVVCQELFFGGICRSEFSYAHVNEPIDAAAFRLPATAGVPRQPFKLEAGYDHFFLKACDGSDGRMSARWGQEGQNGTSSSGLN